MDVSNTVQMSNATASSSSKSSGSSTVDYNAFLQLLIAEMRNQDPTEPMKTADYMGQFASFSNVEQGIQMNSKLDAMLTASALTMADGLLGHTVTSADGSVTGVVKSLRIISGGLIATLDNGKELAITEGIKIS
jgi:flagellar basal-body rod modification protein FlgD